LQQFQTSNYKYAERRVRLLKPKKNSADFPFFWRLNHSKTTFFFIYPLLNRMRGRFFQNLTANGLQLILNQGFGLLAFYILAIRLPKEDFGQLNWILALLLTAFGLLGLGIDQLVVRKIAGGENSAQAFSLFVFHTLLTGLVFYGILAFAYFLIPTRFGSEAILYLGLGKLFFYFSSPFKQLAAGLERFRELLYMSLISSLIKAAAILLFTITGKLNLQTAVLVYLFADLTEFIITVLIAKTRLGIETDFKQIQQNYVLLLKQAWPQVGSVVFSVTLTRIDWILVGLMVSTTKLAEYSFAYRIFELSLLPLMIIGPVLLPWFSRKFSQGWNGANRKSIWFLKTEIIIATMIALLFCILWAPVTDAATNGRYGKINQPVIYFLAAAMPFLYVNNFLWTILFSQKMLKPILKIIVVTLFINIIADVLMIPYFHNAGAAAGFLIATLFQCGLFLYYNPVVAKKMLPVIFLVPLTAAVTVFIGWAMDLSWLLLLAITMTAFLSVLYLFGFMKKRQLRFLNYVVN
jgi:O-antigen/teichoic acid export membrane protein